MKKNNILRFAICLLMTAMVVLNGHAQFTWRYSIENGVVKTEVPQREAGQQHALGLTTAKLPVVRVAFVGLGMRGPDAVERFTHIPGTQVMALCDYERERAEQCQKYLRKASMPAADIYSGENGYVQAQGHRPRLYRYRLAAPFPRSEMRIGEREARGD